VTPLRRTNRAIPDTEARKILTNAEWGVLSLITEDGPYGVPLNFCVIDDDIYFHCAVEGRKLDGMKDGAPVSFCAVGSTEVLASKFGTLYESVIAEGAIEEVHGPHKQRGLEELIRKYSTDYIAEGMAYIEAKGPRARVFKISVKHLTGKARRG
jgi:uncharacterized protein